VTSEPDVVESTVTEDWEFILLACDGIWDVMSNQQVCDFILKRLALNMQPENICEELMDRCVVTGIKFWNRKVLIASRRDLFSCSFFIGKKQYDTFTL
jgi:hypothetical protein